MNEEKAETERTRPVHQIRFGALRVAVWKHQGDHGAMYHVTASRSYTTTGDDGKEVWHDSGSFGRDDLLVLAKAFDEAHSWICSQR